MSTRIPSDHQIRADAEFLGFLDKTIDRLIRHAERARSGGPDEDAVGFKSNHGFGGVGGAGMTVEDENGDTITVSATSVERAALAGPRKPSPVEKNQALLFSALGQAASAKRGVLNTLDALDGQQTPDKPTAKSSPQCCEPGCEMPAEKAGRCNTDYMRKYRWELDHPGDKCPPLTPEELERRNPPKRAKVV